MKLKEIPVYLDLLRLPLPVVLKRLRKRMGFSKAPDVRTSAPTLEFRSERKLGIDQLPLDRLDDKKWQLILAHYQKHELNFLGSGWCSLLNREKPESASFGEFPRSELEAEQLDWNRDQRSGFQFSPSDSPALALSRAFSTNGVDVKCCWEFARLHHLPQLALAIRKFPQQQEVISSLWRKHFQSFQHQCPMDQGVHWSSPMEVAIRLVNVLLGFEGLRHTLPELEDEVARFAAEHWFFLKHHLEHKDGFGTNHYLSNLMGLIVAGFYLEGDQVAATQKWASLELERELQKQFFPDGFNFEYSSYYHRLSTEIAMISLLAAQKSALPVSDRSREIVQKAICAIVNLQKPDGRLPLFGDNDSGRILDLDPAGMVTEDFKPVPEVCSFITQLWQKDSLYYSFFAEFVGDLPHCSEGVKLNVKSSSTPSLPYKKEWAIRFPQQINLEEIKRIDYPDAGLFIFKSDLFYLAINLMSNPGGHRYRGHMHNDKGSFDLQVAGLNLVADPGVFSYTSSVRDRNNYRSTAAHALPYTGIEQNRYLEGSLGLFHMKLDAHCTVLDISATGLLAKITYRGVKHMRRFEIRKDQLLVTDHCNKPFTISKNPNISLTEGYGKTI